ncbi:UbiA family prenyltransferase [Halobaculum sp. CBA1158]|uniref:UbiA family prenyltransferase n=1 Tax=Halobaculum sp. CBA1158 TaxID=2904243 RepID=UPI001F1E1730|nr:UbiA family prenyltransferase [Halobaculum sp. CBA1158]UIO99650.1 UbiA family prenyltransferase [Halobaculum sp. CBA1158]
MPHEQNHTAEGYDRSDIGDRVREPGAHVVERVTDIGERAGNALVYSSAYLAVVAMAEVAIAMTLLSLPPSPAPLVVGLVTFAVYTHDRVADADTDAVSDPERSAFVRRHRNALYLLGSVSYGLALALAVLGGPVALAATLIPGAFWLAYAADVMPAFGSRLRRLKEVFLVNSLIVALAWATTLTALPVAFTDAAVTPTTLVVFGYFLLRSFVDTEIPNVGDVVADRAIGVSTLPTVLGVSATRRALVAVDLCTVGVVAAAVATGALSAAPAVALGVGVAYSVGVIAMLDRVDADAVALAAECEYLVVAAVLFAPALVA